MATPADILRLPDRELWLVTAGTLSEPAGLIATFVSNASIVPELPRVVVGLAKQHYTWQQLVKTRSFVLHLLDESNLDLVWRFGLQSGHQASKFTDIHIVASPTGTPRLTNVVGWLDCRVEAEMDTGDRTVFLADVTAGQLDKSTPLLTMQRLLQLAPPDRLQQLRDGMTRDSAVDAAAIRRWRQAKA